MTTPTTRQRTRGDLLADLADAVNELTEPRTVTEYMESQVIEEVVNRKGRKRTRRTMQRKAHHITLPGLIQCLSEAMVPGSDGELGAAAGAFESRPSAELGPASVLREINDRASYWANRLDLDRPTLSATLRGLVGAHHTDDDLGKITRDAKRWVKRARLATGIDAAPMTIEAACPYCFKRHALVISGDMENAWCSRCGVRWDFETIGLLADMLRTNTTAEIAPLQPCWWPGCLAYGPHEEHHDGQGRTWRDFCELSVPDERIGA